MHWLNRICSNLMQPHFVESQKHAGYFGRSLFKCQGQDTTLLVLSFTIWYFQPIFQPAGISEMEGQGPPDFCRSVTLESRIDVGQGITVGPGKFVKKNKYRALNKRRTWTKFANLCYKNSIKLENICTPWEKFQKVINVGPLLRL